MQASSIRRIAALSRTRWRRAWRAASRSSSIPSPHFRWGHALGTRAGRAICGADGDVLYLDGSIFDIGDRKRLEAQLEHLAYHDALTGLPNRRRLMEDLGSVDGRQLLVFFDLDGFKAYNDSFGHLEGDLLLRRLSRKLRDAVERRGVAFRLGGDEFCILGPMPSNDGSYLVAACLEALSEEGEGFVIKASWGRVVLPTRRETPQPLLCWLTNACTPTKVSGACPRSSRRGTSSCASWQKDVRSCTSTPGPCAALARSVGSAWDLRRRARRPGACRRAARRGKIAIPDAILNKPGPLDDEEWRFMRRHTVIGESMLSAAPVLQPRQGSCAQATSATTGPVSDGIRGSESRSPVASSSSAMPSMP